MSLTDATQPAPACATAQARDGATIYFERFAPPDRPAGSGGDSRTILLVMGLGANGRGWAPMVRRLLGAGFDLVAFDNRGCGRSTTPLRPWTTSLMAEDAVTVLAEAGVGRAHVVGASLGGMIAQELALRNPERVRTLTLGCTSGGWPRLDLVGYRGLAELLDAGVRSRLPGAEDDAAIRHLLRAGCSPDFAESCHPGDEGFETARSMLEDPMPPLGFSQQLMAAARHSTWSRLGELEMPVLIQHGTADRIVPVAAARELARRIPHAELKVTARAGHALGLERPDTTVGTIVSFIEANDAGARRGSAAAAAAERRRTARAG